MIESFTLLEDISLEMFVCIIHFCYCRRHSFFCVLVFRDHLVSHFVSHCLKR